MPYVGMAQAEHELHLATIRGSSFKKETKRGIEGDSAFIEHVIRNILEEPHDVMFVSNRLLLPTLCLSECSETGLIIHDTLGKRKELYIEIFTRKFDPQRHDIVYEQEENGLIQEIDGLIPYGAVESLPATVIDSISMRLGRRNIPVPKEAYQDLYNPNLCDGGYFKQPLSAFTSMNGDYIYLYLYGGESSGTYFAKLIFDKKRYIKKIVAEYQDLIRYGGIRPDFIGF
ncbi:MAG: hypothetical protein AAFY71_08450 [Bacteroidota bacterium]